MSEGGRDAPVLAGIIRGAKKPRMVATFGGLAAVLDIQEMSQGQACGLLLSRPVVMIDQDQRFGPRGF